MKYLNGISDCHDVLGLQVQSSVSLAGLLVDELLQPSAQHVSLACVLQIV